MISFIASGSLASMAATIGVSMVPGHRIEVQVELQMRHARLQFRGQLHAARKSDAGPPERRQVAPSIGGPTRFSVFRCSWRRETDPLRRRETNPPRSPLGSLLASSFPRVGGG